ncbi:hypothetical protein V6N12_059316 [Hibiscus sabdariffa]|uniref:Uncharacterized protein n=1 Tax=Hibiscus sabdariffa TaxID=183260 RepID=A0ABR2EUT0_9ROSI
MAPSLLLRNKRFSPAPWRYGIKRSKLNRRKSLRRSTEQLKRDMAEISREASDIKEGQRKLRQRFEAIESDCCPCGCQCQSRKETTEVLMQGATAQLHILSDFSLAVFQTTSQKVFGGFHEGLSLNAVRRQDQRSSVGSNDLHHQEVMFNFTNDLMKHKKATVKSTQKLT